MAQREVKIGVDQEGNNGGLTMLPGNCPQLTLCGKPWAKTGCLVSKILVFAFLCSAAGCLLTIYWLGDSSCRTPSIEENMNDAFERCFQSEPIVVCELRYTRALAERLKGGDYTSYQVAEATVAGDPDWGKLSANVDGMKTTVDAEDFGGSVKKLRQMHQLLSAGIRK